MTFLLFPAVLMSSSSLQSSALHQEVVSFFFGAMVNNGRRPRSRCSVVRLMALLASMLASNDQIKGLNKMVSMHEIQSIWIKFHSWIEF
jgi:hypothetical protein